MVVSKIAKDISFDMAYFLDYNQNYEIIAFIDIIILFWSIYE